MSETPATPTTMQSLDSLARVLDGLTPCLTTLTQIHARKARDEIFWLWVKRLGLLLLGLVLVGLYALSMTNLYGLAGTTLNEPGVIIVDVSGAIGPDALASGDRVVPLIDKACKSPNTQALVLRINSPGGSPADAERIGAAVDRCKKGPSGTRQVIAVIDGMGASAGYLIAVHADRIFANGTALVGSIGVILSSLEFGGALDRLGIRQREYVTGSNKGAFSPYHQDTPGQARYAQQLVDGAMAEFRSVVLERRPGIDPEAPELFSGRVWTAQQAKTLHLIDDVGIYEDILVAEFGDTPRLLIRPRRSLAETMQMETWVNAIAARLQSAGGVVLQ